jgi:hypothetical protein
LSSCDICRQLENADVIRHTPLGNGNFRQSALIIPIAEIRRPGYGEMGLAAIRVKVHCPATRFLSQRDTGRSMIDSIKIDPPVDAGEFTIGEQKSWVVSYSLLQ